MSSHFPLDTSASAEGTAEAAAAEARAADAGDGDRNGDGGRPAGRRATHRQAGRPGAIAQALSGVVAQWPVLRVAEHDARIWARAWRNLAITGILTPLLFLGAMGVGLGGLVDSNSGRVDGLSYLVFVTPGILAAALLQTAAGDSMWPVMGGMKWTKTFHAAVATPLRPGDVYGGYLVWTACKLAVNAACFLVVATLLGGVPSAWGVLAIPAAVAGALGLAAPLVAFSAGRDNDVAFPIIFRVLVQPLFLFSGTFFPISQLPAALVPLAWASPLWHAVEVCRAATTGTLGWAAMGHVAYLAACITAGWMWGTRVFTRRLGA